MAQRSRIVILGGGFAGAFCAQRLCRALHSEEAEVVLVDRHNYFAFTPLLIEAGVGALEPRHTIVPIRSFVGRGRFLMAEVTGVDPSRRSVSALVGGESEIDLAYDHLVLAMGTVSRPPQGPGMDRAMPLKHLSDAVALRDRAVRMLEMASAEPDAQRRRRMLRMIVIGGNFTGVEAAGEFHAFLHRAAKRYPALDPSEVGVTLCELGDRLLDGLDDKLAAYAERSMRARGVDIRLGDTVESYEGDVATLKSGERLGARTIIWAAGNAPNPLLEQIDLPRDEKGYLRAHPDMRIEGCDEVWGVGDCAVNPDPDGNPYPPTAQMAVQQGRAVADNIARALRDRPTKPLAYESKGSLAALGCRTGVAKVMGVCLRGFAAWWLWRTVYLMKMPGWGRRMRVAMDWTLDLFSRQDIVELALRRPEAEERQPDSREPTMPPEPVRAE